VGCHSTDRTLAMIEYTYQYTSVHLCVMRQWAFKDLSLSVLNCVVKRPRQIYHT
jgi:hypothetical protein